MVKIMRCTCQHEFQDQVYGPGMRVFNAAGKDGKVSEYRCTVCGKKVSS